MEFFKSITCALVCFLALSLFSDALLAATTTDISENPSLRMVCETIAAPKVDKKTLPPSCDKVCASKELTCVWNTAPINPNGCDAPAYASCRCCTVEVAK